MGWNPGGGNQLALQRCMPPCRLLLRIRPNCSTTTCGIHTATKPLSLPPPSSSPTRRSFTYEEFNACQQRHQKKAAEGLAVRNEEVLRCIEDIIELVR